MPLHLELPSRPGALEPPHEQADPPADQRTGNNPLVDKILTEIQELELLLVQPADELDRLGDLRLGVPQRHVASGIAAGDAEAAALD